MNTLAKERVIVSVKNGHLLETFEEREQSCKFQVSGGEKSHGISGEGILALALERTGYKSCLLHPLARQFGAND